MKNHLLTVVAIALLTAPAAARTGKIATTTGHCTKLMAMGISTNPDWCIDKLQNLDLANGRNGFVFIIKSPHETKPAIIAFFGWGPKQVHVDRDNVRQPIDRVDFTFHGSTDHFKATGTCTFGNPYKGETVVSCHADTSEGKFVGEFESDGLAPDITDYAPPRQ